MMSFLTSRFKRCFLPLLLYVVAQIVIAENYSPEFLLDRMSHSYRELSYSGRFTYQQGEELVSLRLRHAVIDGEEYERLEYLDGDKREIIRRGHDLNCIHPGHQLVRFYHQNKQALKGTGSKGASSSAGGLASVSKYYQFTVAGSERIAGRKAVKLFITPRDTHRFGYRLYLDEETGLLLRSELIGNNERILERFQFVSIDIGGDIPRSSFSTAAHSYYAEHVAPEVEPGQVLVSRGKGWMVKWLPGGFTETVANQKVVEEDMTSFTDGLSVFSVFLEKDIDAAKMARGVEGRASRGATIAYSRALLLNNHPHRVTVVGEIPSETAQQIAQSVVLVSP